MDGVRRRRQRPRARADRHGQDLCGGARTDRPRAARNGRCAAAADAVVADAVARAGERHGPGTPPRRAGAQSALDDRRAHRRHVVVGARPPGAAAAHRADHDAGKPDAHAVARRLAGALRARDRRRLRRMARTDGVQARRADRTRARAAARLASPAADVGTVGHARQPGPGARLSRGPVADAGDAAANAHRPGPGHEDDRDRQRAAEDHRTVSMGRPHRAQDAAGGDPRHRVRAQHARVHQRAFRHRDVVPGAAGRAAGLGGHDRAASRLAGTRRARLGRGGTARRQAARGRLHVEPRSRRGLRAGRPGAADRQSERRGPPAATRRPQRTPPGRDLARDGGSRAGARARRGRRRTRRGRRPPHRAADADRGSAGCARPASRHLRARRRLSPRRTARRSTRHACVRDADRRRMAMGDGLRRPRRREPQCVSGVPARRDRRRRRRARARPADRAPPPDGHRHDRQRYVDHRAVPQRRETGAGRGELRGLAVARRLLRVRGTAARVHPRPRADGVGQAGVGQVRARAALDGQQDGADVRAAPTRRAR